MVGTVMRMIPDISRASRSYILLRRLVNGTRARAAESYHDNLNGIETGALRAFEQ